MHCGNCGEVFEPLSDKAWGKCDKCKKKDYWTGLLESDNEGGTL